MLEFYARTNRQIVSKQLQNSNRWVFSNSTCNCDCEACAIVIFIFGLKGWADFTPIIAGANMWMNNLDETVINSTSAPIYCDNPYYDYIYDSQWRYDKNSCIDKPVNEIFNNPQRFVVFCDPASIKGCQLFSDIQLHKP